MITKPNQGHYIGGWANMMADRGSQIEPRPKQNSQKNAIRCSDQMSIFSVVPTKNVNDCRERRKKVEV